MIKSADLTTDFRLFVNGVDTKLSAWTAVDEVTTGEYGSNNGYSPKAHTHASTIHRSRASLNAMLYLDKDDEVKVVNNVADVDADGNPPSTTRTSARCGQAHVTTGRPRALLQPRVPPLRLRGLLNAELEMGATCTVGDGQCINQIVAARLIDLRAGEGVYFDGVDDYAELDNVELGGPMTISLWVKWEAITDDAHLFDFGNGDVSDNIKIKNDQTTNTLQLELNRASTRRPRPRLSVLELHRHQPFDLTNIVFTTRLTTTTTRST